ncbi:MAG TPA: Ig-like domain repeat protein [Acidimicrobiales bacterium]|nr:Ig-like domain repeat protein [Acidimicrobiales bacterium]
MRRRSVLPVPAVAATVLCTMAALLVAVAPPAMATVFTNAATITVPDAVCAGAVGTATPYPSTINVSGVAGTVTDVNVTLSSITSDYTGDLEVLLVGPGGTPNLLLMSDAGQSNNGVVSNLTITFDDAAASFLPQNADLGANNSSIIRKPTNYTEGTADTFPAPAPAPSGNTTLAAFNGISPNGTWSLYVIDDQCGDANDTIGGWSLDVTGGTAAVTTTMVASSVNPSATGQSVTFTATVASSGGPVTTGTVTFTEGGTTLASNVAVNGSGQAAFSTSALTEGDHIVTATYNGTASFGTSNGSVNQRVDNATTNPSAGVFCNTGAITIPSNLNVTPAVPYPSHITVSGFAGTVGNVTAQLKNVTHGFSDDIEVLLVGPNPANNLVLVSDAPSNTTAPVSNVTVTFDDTASSFLPTNAAWGAPNSSVTAKPTDYDPGGAVDTFPSPAPAPSSSTTLAGAFGGINPNGQWSLYVVDDGLGDAGSIAGGWCLTLTAPAVADLSVTKTDSPDPVVAGSNITYSIGVSNSVVGSTASSVVLSDPVPANTTFVSLSSPAGWTCILPAVGSSGGTVTCNRPTLTAADGAQSFTLVVKVNLPTPAATPIQNTATVSSTPTDSGPGANTASATTTVGFAPSRPALVRNSTQWLLRNTLTTGSPDTSFSYGAKPLSPIMGDWDGDGTKTAGTFESGTFKLNNANDSSAADITPFTFGDPRGFPVAGDFNGDGVDDVGVYRAGLWQIRLSTGATSSFSFGSGTWPAAVPVVGDWNGDGVDGIGLYTLMAPGTLGEWNLRNTASAGAPDLTFVFGGSGLYPVVGDWDGDGIDTVGYKSMSSPTWSLRNTNSPGAPTVTFDYGLASDLPLAWRVLNT